MVKPKPTKEQVKEAAIKVVEYEKKMKQLQEEYAEYRKIFRLRGKSTIDSEWSLRWPLNQYFPNEESAQLSREIFTEILTGNEELAYKYIDSKTYSYETKTYVDDGYRDVCFQCLLKHPNKLFKKIEDHLRIMEYNSDNTSRWYRDGFQFTQIELDDIWQLNGNYYMESSRNTVNNLYTLFLVYADKFTYDDKMLLAKRIMGRSKDTRALVLIKHPNIPQDIKDLLESYLLMQKLK